MNGKKYSNMWLAVCLLLAVLAWPAAADTHYVSPGQSIQDAINAAVDYDEIEVAPGTYNEAINFNGKAVRLYSIGGPEVTTIDGTGNYHVVQCVSGEGANTILEDFTITGGNANGPEWPNDKNGGGMYCRFSSPTVVGCRFSGNTGEYGGGLASLNSEPTLTNCTFTGNSGEEGGGLYNILSPITVTNCIFTGNSAGHGGGINNDSTQAVVTNCLFSANTSTFGGGMYNLGGTPTVTNCTFTGNSAPYGGGIDNYNSNPIVTNCTFSGNSAQDGGGMFNGLSSPTVTDCNFTDNIAQHSGGGMYSKDDSNSIVTNCTFSGNEARGNTTNMGGGGMYNLNNSNPTVTNCTFSSNWALWEGGGMRNSNSSPTITNCTFSYNTTDRDGGGMYNIAFSSPTLTNCILSNNTANWGGGMYNYYQSNPTFTNCTFTGNVAGAVGQGGGMFNFWSSRPKVTNCILWGNIQEQIVDQDSPTSTTTVTYSDVQGGWPGVLVIDADPLFVNAAGGDLRLSSSASPCIDVGYNAPNLPPTDLAGNPRIVDGDRNGTAIVDMGAYEFQTWLIHNTTGDNWYETIQAAINAAANGDEIEVAPGTYNEAINFKGKTIRLYSSGGPEVTTIDGTGAYHVVQCVSGEGANTILEGFTITGGNANGAGNDSYGGGMYNSDSRPTVTDCIFQNNTARVWGAGMFNNQSSPTVTNCRFISNVAGLDGGGMYNALSSPTVTNCTFSGNRLGAGDGGGMHNNLSSPTVTNCTFSNNRAYSNGGGMYNCISKPTLTNCTFSGNSATNDYSSSTFGGGMYNLSSNPTVTNCTFSGNTAFYGGGMTNINLDYPPTDVSSSPTVTNCIFNGNSAAKMGGGMLNIGGLDNYVARPNVTNCIFIGNMAGTNGGGMINWVNSSPTVTNCILRGDTPDEIFNSDGTSTVTYSNVEGGWGGTGNIDADPCFVDSGNPDPNVWNLRLKPDSPCIDAGDTTAVPGGIWADLDGNPRVSDNPEIPDTGISILGATVDMGVYEFQPCRIAGDINCDGVVDFKDLAILAANWLAGTEPEL